MDKEKREIISTVASLVNIVAFVVLTTFGYFVSKDVRTIQANSDRRASANEVKEFWRDMSLITQKAGDKSGRLGSALTKYLIASGGLLDAYNQHYPIKNSKNLHFDIKYNIAHAEFIGAYGDLTSLIASIAIEYDYARLQYHQLALEHEFSGWKEFFDQTSDVRKWKQEVTSDVHKIFDITYKTVTEFKEPKVSAKQIEEISKEIGDKLKIFSIPYVTGLSKFSAANLEQYAKDFNR